MSGNMSRKRESGAKYGAQAKQKRVELEEVINKTPKLKLFFLIPACASAADLKANDEAASDIVNDSIEKELIVVNEQISDVNAHPERTSR